MTVIVNSDLRRDLNTGEPIIAESARQKVKDGNMKSLIKVTFAGLTSAAAQNITTTAAKTAGTIVGIDLESAETLPPIGHLVSLRVTAGAAAVGDRVLTDAGGTAGAPGANGPGKTIISDDGKTLTFEAAVTGFVLQYYPRAAFDLTTTLVQGAP